MTRVKTGGRQAGTKNRITEAHRLAIHRACREIGSGRALVGGNRSDPLVRFYVRAWQAEPATFLSKVLPAVLPPPPRSESEEGETFTPFEPCDLRAAAMRISFVLESVRQETVSAAPVDIIEARPVVQAPEPVQALPPLDEFPTYPVPGQEVIEETRTETLEIYRGSAAEQGRSRDRPDVIDRRRQSHDEYISRLAAHHRRDLL